MDDEVFCNGCGALVDSASRGCSNPKCPGVKAISVDEFVCKIQEEISTHELRLEHDDVIDRAIRRGLIEGLKRSIECANRLVAE